MLAPAARPLHQFLDERLHKFREEAQRTVRKRATFAKDWFQLIQRRQILAPLEEADWDDLAPQTPFLHSAMKVGRVTTHLF